MADSTSQTKPQAASGGRTALLAWIAVPVLLGILLLVGFWLAPALESNTEEPARPAADGIKTGNSQR